MPVSPTSDFVAQYMAFPGNYKAFSEKFSILPEKMAVILKKTSIKMAEFQFLPYICGVLLRNFLKFD
ncbi:hypothetical protein DWW27_21550 [Phocaeicola vulgatus]|uniref:Uncharacterized protein n=1 Tax=Phocaeicola vulgatus TaxID=821 RepID=A0A412VDN2_PHOVU|nr:hypothetical protein DWW27_21550 [Phocaeicola vulgatus]